MYKWTKIFCLLCFITLINLNSSVSHAALLTFDDITTDSQYTLVNDKGFEWTNFDIYNATLSDADSFHKVALYSNNYVAVGKAWNTFSATSMPKIKSEQDFDFKSGYFTGSVSGLNLIITGLNNGDFVDSVAIQLFDDTRQLIQFDTLNSIDELHFNYSETFAGFTQGAPFAVDNINYELVATPVPEPSSIMLGLIGASSLLGLRRKK